MNEDKEVTVTVTPEDAEFRARAVAAGVPSILISMYGKALRRLIADEREACAQIAEEWLGPVRDRELHIAKAIRARGKE